MQRREHEVAGLGSGDRGRDRLEVAHLAEEDHVGVLAERCAESLAEARRVCADLALVHDAPLVAMEELDRILDRDDVVVPRAVDLVDHRRERRRLARARRARDEHEAARPVCESRKARRQSELLERLERSPGSRGRRRRHCRAASRRSGGTARGRAHRTRGRSGDRSRGASASPSSGRDRGGRESSPVKGPESPREERAHRVHARSAASRR